MIAPGIDWPVGTAARIAARYGLPHPISPDDGRARASKLRQRERLEQAGVPQTRWQVVTEPDDERRLPCVVQADRTATDVAAASLVRTP